MFYAKKVRIWVNSVHEGKKCKKTEKVQKNGKKRERVFPEWQIKGFFFYSIIFFQYIILFFLLHLV